MVSATDPAAVVATFKRLRVPPALSTMVDGESLLNDGTGLVLFAIALQAVVAADRPGRGRRRLRRDRRDQRRASASRPASSPLGSSRCVDDHLIELTISVVLAYGSYMLADVFHLSGVIATVTAAIVLGNVGPGRALTATGADAIDTVWEFFAYLLTAVVFLLVGLADPAGAPRRVARPDRLGDRRHPRRSRRSWSTCCSAVRRVWRPARGWPRRVPDRLAPRPVLGRSARGGGRRDGARPCRPTSRSGRCSRRSRSGSSCSRCSSRERRSGGSSTGRSARRATDDARLAKRRPAKRRRRAPA